MGKTICLGLNINSLVTSTQGRRGSKNSNIPEVFGRHKENFHCRVITCLRIVYCSWTSRNTFAQDEILAIQNDC